MRLPIFVRLGSLFLSILLLTSCWDQKESTKIEFISSFGFDYVNNKYYLYAQTFDFNALAKQEGASSQPPSVYIGKGEGDTVVAAINDLNSKSQAPMFSGFVSAVVFSDRALKKGIDPYIEAMNRFGLIRYTKWIYGTKMPFEEIFPTISVSSLSPLTTWLHHPTDIYKKGTSTVEPIKFHQFLSRFWDQADTTLLPALGVTQKAWKKDKKKVPSLIINGAFTLHEGKLKGEFLTKDLDGLRWMNPDTEQEAVTIHVNESKLGVFLFQPKIHIHPYTKNGNLHYNIDIKVDAQIREQHASYNQEDLKRNIESELKKEVRHTYDEGIKQHTDLLRLEIALYRHNVKKWRNYKKEGKLDLKKDTLNAINVHVTIRHAGKYKTKYYPRPYGEIK